MLLVAGAEQFFAQSVGVPQYFRPKLPLLPAFTAGGVSRLILVLEAFQVLRSALPFLLDGLVHPFPVLLAQFLQLCVLPLPLLLEPPLACRLFPVQPGSLPVSKGFLGLGKIKKLFQNLVCRAGYGLACVHVERIVLCNFINLVQNSFNLIELVRHSALTVLVEELRPPFRHLLVDQVHIRSLSLAQLEVTKVPPAEVCIVCDASAVRLRHGQLRVLQELPQVAVLLVQLVVLFYRVRDQLLRDPFRLFPRSRVAKFSAGHAVIQDLKVSLDVRRVHVRAILSDQLPRSPGNGFLVCGDLFGPLGLALPVVHTLPQHLVLRLELPQVVVIGPLQGKLLCFEFSQLTAVSFFYREFCFSLPSSVFTCL